MVKESIHAESMVWTPTLWPQSSHYESLSSISSLMGNASNRSMFTPFPFPRSSDFLGNLTQSHRFELYLYFANTTILKNNLYIYETNMFSLQISLKPYVWSVCFNINKDTEIRWMSHDSLLLLLTQNVYFGYETCNWKNILQEEGSTWKCLRNTQGYWIFTLVFTLNKTEGASDLACPSKWQARECKPLTVCPWQSTIKLLAAPQLFEGPGSKRNARHTWLRGLVTLPQ